MKRKSDFSKKMLVLHICITLCLCAITVVGTLAGVDVTVVGALAGTSFITDGAWGGFYLWKAKNENRSKYAQQFIRLVADRYGVEAAIRIAEVVLKD